VPPVHPVVSPAEDLERLIRSGAVRLTTPTPSPGPASSTSCGGANGVGPPNVAAAASNSFQPPSRRVSANRDEGSAEPGVASTPGIANTDSGRCNTGVSVASTITETAAVATIAEAVAPVAIVPTTSGAATPPFTEAASQHATMLRGLPARLVALCNRQCLASGLSSEEQDDALRILTTALRRAREPLSSCGILFSAVPPQAVPAAVVTASATPPVPTGTALAGLPLAGTRNNANGTGSPRLNPLVYPASLRADASPFRAPSATASMLASSTAGASGQVRPPTPTGSPGSPLLSLPAAVANAGILGNGGTSASAVSVGGQTPCGASAGGASAAMAVTGIGTALAGVVAADVGQQACTRHIYELLSYLSDIRSLALALELPQVAAATESEPLPTFSLTPPAAEQDSAGMRVTVDAGLAAPSETMAAAGQAPPEPLPPPTDAATTPVTNEAFATSAMSQATVPNGASTEAAVEAVSVSASATSRAVSPGGANVAGTPGTAPGTGGEASTHSANAPPFMASTAQEQEVVSQLIQGVDQAAVAGGQALEEAGAVFSELLLRLDEVSRDREIWAQRFLAARELQYSADLCDRALRLDGSVPVAESVAVS